MCLGTTVHLLGERGVRADQGPQDHRAAYPGHRELGHSRCHDAQT